MNLYLSHRNNLITQYAKYVAGAVGGAGLGILTGEPDCFGWSFRVSQLEH